MSNTHTVRFYPVGNGDTSQIITANGKRFLFDFCNRKSGPDDKRIDLAVRLDEELAADKRADLDVVAFSHCDADHIAGGTDYFELRHSKDHQGDKRKKINALWVPAAMLLEVVDKGDREKEFALWKKEAWHRLMEGKGIVVFSKPKALREELETRLKARGEALNARDHLFVDAGQLVAGYTLQADGIEFFCHSPYKEHCDNGEDIVRNDASVILNIRMRVGTVDTDFFQCGDSTWEVLEKIVHITRLHGRQDRLEWDLFNIPHHCSYKALSDVKGDLKTEPKPKVKELLLSGRKGAFMVSSSDPIANTREAYQQDQPPHVQAYNSYKDHLDQVQGRKVLVTMSEPTGYNPQPIEFAVGSGGISKLAAAATGAASVATVSPSRAGLSTSPRLG